MTENERWLEEAFHDQQEQFRLEKEGVPQVVEDSGWRNNFDQEYKALIGVSDEGFHYAFVAGESDGISWSEAYATQSEAKDALEQVTGSFRGDQADRETAYENQRIAESSGEPSGYGSAELNEALNRMTAGPDFEEPSR